MLSPNPAWKRAAFAWQPRCHIPSILSMSEAGGFASRPFGRFALFKTDCTLLVVLCVKGGF